MRADGSTNEDLEAITISIINIITITIAIINIITITNHDGDACRNF